VFSTTSASSAASILKQIKLGVAPFCTSRRGGDTRDMVGFTRQQRPGSESEWGTREVKIAGVLAEANFGRRRRQCCLGRESVVTVVEARTFSIAAA
jgi:hypothetical protein